MKDRDIEKPCPFCNGTNVVIEFGRPDSSNATHADAEFAAAVRCSRAQCSATGPVGVGATMRDAHIAAVTKWDKLNG